MSHRVGIASKSRPAVVCVAGGALLLGSAIGAADPDVLHRTMEIDSVRIEVTWVGSQAELEAKAREYGAMRPQTTVIKKTLEAFSVLGRQNGELVCLIFARQPERFDDRDNTSLGHELLHCLGFSHRR